MNVMQQDSLEKLEGNFFLINIKKTFSKIQIQIKIEEQMNIVVSEERLISLIQLLEKL